MYVKSALLTSEMTNERWTQVEYYLLVEWEQESSVNLFITDMWIDGGCEVVLEVTAG